MGKRDEATGGHHAEAEEAQGRLPKLTMPAPIDATPEEIAEVMLREKPKETWRYLEQEKKGKTR